MSAETQLKVSSFGSSQYGISAASRRAMINYGKVLLAIAGADGAVSAKEYEWLVEHQRKFGAPEDVIAEYAKFDYRTADFGALMAEISVDVATWRPAPHLIYHAIQMCGADGHYAEAERSKVVKAARALGVSDDIVLALHALIQMEKAVYDMRAALFHVNVLAG